jgi:adenine-specific DNA-methyltransferase
LIENNNQVLTKEDINFLFSQSQNKSQYTLIEDIYTDLFFEREQAIFLDNFRANVDNLDNLYKKSLALTLINRSLQRKITMGHFAHTQALIYANNEERISPSHSNDFYGFSGRL